MKGKNDDSLLTICEELWTYVQEHLLFPEQCTNLLSHVKYTRKKINEGTLEEWKRVMFEEIAEMRDLSIHTEGRKCKTTDGNK